MADASAIASNMSFDTAEARPLGAEDFLLLRRWRSLQARAASGAEAGEAPDLTEGELEELKAHVLAVWADVKKSLHVYRCVQTLTFLTPRAPSTPGYQDLISTYRAAKVEMPGRPFRVLDLGCGFGQDTRALILDGLDPVDITVADVHDGYWRAGRRLFGDDGARVREGGALEKVSTAFGDWAAPLGSVEDVAAGLEGSFQGVMLMHVLHVLSKEQCEAMLSRLACVAAPGALLFGAAVGSASAGEWQGATTPDGSAKRWLHSAESLQDTLQRSGWGLSMNVSLAERRALQAGVLPSLPERLGEMRHLQFVARRG